MAIIYSKLDGKPKEVSDRIFNELVEFENSYAYTVLTHNSSKPLEADETRVGLTRLGKLNEEMKAQEAQEAEAERTEAKKRMLEPPPMDPQPGADWKDLVG